MIFHLNFHHSSHEDNAHDNDVHLVLDYEPILHILDYHYATMLHGQNANVGWLDVA